MMLIAFADASVNLSKLIGAYFSHFCPDVQSYLIMTTSAILNRDAGDGGIECGGQLLGKFADKLDRHRADEGPLDLWQQNPAPSRLHFWIAQP